jgi:hypothetical protein
VLWEVNKTGFLFTCWKTTVILLIICQDLKLYTSYSSPEHQDKGIRKTMEEVIAREEHFDGKPTEK